MEIQDLFDIAKTENSDRFKMKFSEFIREHPQYSNLDQGTRDIIFNLIHKHMDAIREGRGISGYLAEREMHELYEKRLNLGLTPKDLEDIKSIFSLFQK